VRSRFGNGGGILRAIDGRSEDFTRGELGSGIRPGMPDPLSLRYAQPLVLPQFAHL
jgi:hypothetical protein